jgi:hypothetical protein
MPQFDKITFFTQIFWLFFFFLGFYLIFLKTFLPKLASVLKVRAKKLQKGVDGVSIFAEEQETTISGFNNSLENVFSIVKNSINIFKEKMLIWSDSGVQTLNNKDLVSSNTAIEKAFHKHLATITFYDRLFDSKSYSIKFLYFPNEYSQTTSVDEKSY